MLIAIAGVPLVGRGQVYIIETIAGVDTAGFSGDNGPAAAAKLHYPFRLSIDNAGNIYFADATNNRIRKIDAITTIITTIAGSSDTSGFFGDNGLALNSKLASPEGIILDSIGNIYIADAANNRIRKITKSTGIIKTIAGNGVAGNTGDNGLAVDAELYAPNGLGLDAQGNIYIAEFYSNVIRKVNAVTGIITTIVGNGTPGYTGDSGLAINAEINGPAQVLLDKNDNLYFSDMLNMVVRKVSLFSGIITTIAGNGTTGLSGDGQPATLAQLNQPNGVFVTNNGDIFIADYGNGVIRKINGADGIISTIAGNGAWGYWGDGGPATDAEMVCSDVSVDNMGSIIIVDYGNNCIRKVYNPTGIKQVSNVDDYKLFPNPTTGKFTIQTAANKQFSIEVCNVVGEKIYRSVSNGATTEIDISNQPAGVYFVYLRSGDECAVRKVVVE